jgi:hypothetical protein
MTIYMVTRYVQCGFDTVRENVTPFSEEQDAKDYCVEHDPDYATGPRTLDVVPYELDALKPTDKRLAGGEPEER